MTKDIEVTKEQVREALAGVIDPDLGRDIVSLEFVKEIKVCGGDVGATIELTTPACPVKDQMRSQAERLIKAIPGVKRVDVKMTARTVGRSQRPDDILKGVKNVVAIGSGKGGVGKSTVTANLALILAQSGAKVGVLDADIYGPSIPSMLGIFGEPLADAAGRAIPPENHGVKAMSIGMLAPGDAPAIWRGPIVSRILQQFLGAVNWGELDYLLLDLPPGTGDVQLTLCQSAPLSGAVIVSTPQDVALSVAKKGLRMFEQLKVPVIGLIENMSGFVCPNCGAAHNIFSQGGCETAAKEMGVPFLGRIPLDPRVVEAGDGGTPLTDLGEESTGAKAFRVVTKNFAAQISILNLGMKAEAQRPRQIELVKTETPRIVWGDGSVSTYDHRALRLACPCASCVDEMTGELRIGEEDIAMDIQIAGARPVGNYGLGISFTDGHSTGIYTFERLRQLSEPVDEASSAT